MDVFNATGEAETFFGCQGPRAGSPWPANFNKRKAAGLRADRPIKPRLERLAVSALEVQFQSKLKLTRVEGCGRPAEKMTVAGARIERVYVGKEG